MLFFLQVATATRRRQQRGEQRNSPPGFFRRKLFALPALVLQTINQTRKIVIQFIRAAVCTIVHLYRSRPIAKPTQKMCRAKLAYDFRSSKYKYARAA